MITYLSLYIWMHRQVDNSPRQRCGRCLHAGSKQVNQHSPEFMHRVHPGDIVRKVRIDEVPDVVRLEGAAMVLELFDSELLHASNVLP